MDFAREREDVACRGVDGGGDKRTSPETGTMRLAVSSPADTSNGPHRRWGNAAGRGIAGVGEERTSPESGTPRRAATSRAKARL